MSWYYADNNERRGPLDDAAFQSLVAAGTIKPDTLVWKDGFTDWVPYSQVPASAAGTASRPATPGGAGGTVCSQCGNVFPPDDLVTLGGRLVCGGCKPLVVQQMMEGTSVEGGTSIDPEKFLTELRARGGYRLDVGRIISRAWKVVTSDFWPILGVTLLAYLIMGVSQQIPCVGILAPCLVTGPIFGGLYFYYLKHIRGQPAVIGDAFCGFNKPHFGQLALAGTVQFLGVLVVMAVLIGPAVALNWSSLQAFSSPHPPGKVPEVPVGFVIWCFVASLPVIWLTVSWLFGYVLIVDKRLQFWPAMELSRKVINMNFWGWILLFLVNFLLSIAGVLCLCVGLLVVLPVTFCGMMVAYEDIFSPERTTDS